MPDGPISSFPAVVSVGTTDEFGLDVAGGAPTSKATFQQMIDGVKANAGLTSNQILFGGSSGEIDSDSGLTYNISSQSFRAAGAGLTFNPTGFNNIALGLNIGSFGGTGSGNFGAASNSVTISGATANSSLISTNGCTLTITGANSGNGIYSSNASDITANTSFYCSIMASTGCTLAGDPDQSAIMAGSNIDLTSTQQVLATGRNIVNNNFDNSFYANYLGGTLTAGTANVFAIGASNGLYVTDTAQTVTVESDVLFTIDSTTQASIPMPRMTTAQRDGIPSPATGYMVYNITTDEPNFYDGVAWQAFGSTVPAIPQHRVAFGDAGSQLTSSAEFSYNVTTGEIVFGRSNTNSGGGNDNVLIGGNSNTIGAGGSGASAIIGSNNSMLNFTFGGSNNQIFGGSTHSIGDNSQNNVILGGSNNDIAPNTFFCTILGGSDNDVGGANSVVCGTRVKSTASGILAFSDSTAADFTPTTSNSVSFRVNNGLGVTDANSLTIPADTILYTETTTSAAIPAPRMTTAERDLISTPIEGHLIWNLTTNELNAYNGIAWTSLSGGPAEGTHNTDWTGIWAADQTANIDFQTIGSWVHLSIPATSAVANTSATITNVTALPVSLRPAATERFVLRGTDNGITSFITVTVNTSGVITVGAGPSQAVYTGASGGGNSGFDRLNVSYKV